MLPSESLVKAIKEAAMDCGYLACGITSAEPFELYAEALRRGIRKFPSIKDLYAPMEFRVNPRKTAPWAQSIVVCVRQYGKYKLPLQAADHIGRNYLADRRLPVCPDHSMPVKMTVRLKELGLRIKRGGVPERLAGVRAGVAAIGRNGFAYHPRAGSWINLESWRVDAALPPDQPDFQCPCPPGCNLCIEACPTRALTEPCTMRIDHCIAYLSYSAPWPINENLWRKMGPWIYGCDTCQLSCPLNRGQWREKEPMPWLEPIKHLLTPQALATMNEKIYRQHIHPLFWYIPKEDLNRWRANATRALRYQSHHKTS